MLDLAHKYDNFVNNPPSCIRRICEFSEFLSVSDQIHTFGNLSFGVVYVGRTEIFTFYFGIDRSHLHGHFLIVCTVHRCLFFEMFMSLSLSRQFLRVDSPTWPFRFLVSFSGLHLIWYLTMLSSYSITVLAMHSLRHALETG